MQANNWILPCWWENKTHHGQWANCKITRIYTNELQKRSSTNFIMAKVKGRTNLMKFLTFFNHLRKSNLGFDTSEAYIDNDIETVTNWYSLDWRHRQWSGSAKMTDLSFATSNVSGLYELGWNWNLSRTEERSLVAFSGLVVFMFLNWFKVTFEVRIVRRKCLMGTNKEIKFESWIRNKIVEVKWGVIHIYLSLWAKEATIRIDSHR